MSVMEQYKSVQANLPKEKHGGYPGYPEFEFEYLENADYKEQYDELISRINKYAPDTKMYDMNSLTVGTNQAVKFTYDGEVRYTLSDFSHSYAQVTSAKCFRIHAQRYTNLHALR